MLGIYKRVIFFEVGTETQEMLDLNFSSFAQEISPFKRSTLNKADPERMGGKKTVNVLKITIHL